MVDPNDYLDRPLFSRVARLRRVTFVMLCVERAAKAYLPAITWVCLFTGIWLTGFTASWDDIAQQAMAGVFFIGLFFLILRGARTFTFPGREETDRRLQEQSGVKHRPLSALHDTLAADGAGNDTKILWDKSRGRLPCEIGKLKTALPRPVAALIDPLALRVAAVLVLVIGIVMAGHAAPDRLRTGLWPFAFSPVGLMPSDVATLTITPPAYTGRDTVILKGVMKKDAAPIDIAEGSTIKAHVTGGFGAPIMHMDQTSLPLPALDGKSHKLETTIVPGTVLSITQWLLPRTRANYKYIADRDPVIRMDGDVAVLPRGELRFPLILNDDYGVRDLQMRLDIDPSVLPRPKIGTFYDEIRAVMTKGGEDVKISPVYNLSFHPWAGLPVRITFLATDDKGQAAILPPITLTLPERPFRNEIAAHLIGVRKRLIADPEGDMTSIRNDLIAIGARPHLYKGDIRTHLALSAAIYRVGYNPGLETARAVVPLLWDVAMYLEDGDIGQAARDLQEARENLEQALNDPNATDEQIAALMQQLQDAMKRYMQEMARTMQQRMQDGEQPLIPPEMMAQIVTPQDLDMFFAQLQAEALSGNKDAAREMLSRLSQLMDTMNPAMNAQMPKDVQQMAEAMNKLQDIIDKQEDLLDETRAQIPQKPELPSTGDPVMDDILKRLGATPPPQTDAEKEKSEQAISQCKGGQDALRGSLGDVMQDIGEATGQIPDPMGQAEQEMRKASDSLSQKDPAKAAEHQAKALEHLQQGKEQMSQQMAKRLSQMTGMSLGGAGQRMDPLGRPYGPNQGTNPLLGEKVKVPDESDRKKIEEILQTLRDKSGDMTRPQEELDYYRRLLKQF